MMPVLLLAGILFTLRSRLFQIRSVRFVWQVTVGTLLRRDNIKTGISPFQALTTALAGTMGVGNIAGVATALAAGGPGAVFWMWVSAFFGMMTKYAEIFLAVKYRLKDGKGGYRGGAMYYIENGIGSRRLACVFAVFCALCSLGIGNLTQINSAAHAMNESFGVPAFLSGIICAVIVSLIICGGLRRIARVTEIIIPFLTIILLSVSLIILYRNHAYIPQALGAIISGAMGTREIAGGVMGFGVSQAMRYGLSRGVFTNEAGLGSAPIAHACADCKSPKHQAAWGVFEVFVDTLVVCTITALVILTTNGGRLLASGLDGAALTSAAFEYAFPGIGARFVAVAIAFFAIATMTGWSFYGESALKYLSNSPNVVSYYRAVFIVCIALGSVAGLHLVWRASDILNMLMAVPNCIALILLRREVKY